MILHFVTAKNHTPKSFDAFGPSNGLSLLIEEPNVFPNPKESQIQVWSLPQLCSGKVFTSREAARSREGVVLPGEEEDVCLSKESFDSRFMVASLFGLLWLQ